MQLFSKKFSHFHFISDDRIMFTYWDNTGQCRCGGIYSIKDNEMLKEAKWLEEKIIDVYKDDENSEKIILYVEDEIYSYKLGNKKLLFTVNPNTLQPDSDCYSEFRNCFLEVISREDIEKIKDEDQKKIRIIDEKMQMQRCEQLQKAKEKVLVRKKN